MRLKELREEHGWTQQTLAERLHVRQNTYSQYESGARQLPLECLIALAKLYDVSTDYLLGITNNDAPYPKQ